jgi:hypothetical protein
MAGRASSGESGRLANEGSSLKHKPKRKDDHMNETKLGTAEKSAVKSTPKSSYRVGDVFLDGDVEMVVWFLNPKKGCVAPLNSGLDYRKGDDGMIRFAAGKKSANVSPDQQFEIIRSLGREGLAEHIDAQKKTQTEDNMKKTAKKASKPAAVKADKKPSTPGIRTGGTLGSYKGYSIASVVRALGKAGWKTPEVKAFFDKEKITCSDQTIKINIYRSHHPERPDSGLPAPLTKDQMPEKPVIEVKVKKAPAPKKEVKPAAAKKEPVATSPAKQKASAKPAEKTGTAKAAPSGKPAGAPSKATEQIAALKAAKLAKLKAAAKPAASK